MFRLRWLNAIILAVVMSVLFYILPVEAKPDISSARNADRQSESFLLAIDPAFKGMTNFLATGVPTSPLQIKLTNAILERDAAYQGEIFLINTVVIPYHGGQVFLAANSDGSGSTRVDDKITLTITQSNGTAVTYSHTYCSEGVGCFFMSPLDLSSYFALGTNTVYVELADLYPDKVSSTPLYLVISQPKDQNLASNECPVCSNKSSFRGGPINTYSGNYNYQATDFRLPLLGQSLAFERSYNSQVSGVITTSIYSQTLGYGWTHNLDIQLVFPNDPGGEANKIILQAPHGSRLRFFDQGNGLYSPSLGISANLTRTGATTSTYIYTVTATNQAVYRFDNQGRLTLQKDSAGHALNYTYYPTNSLQSVSDPTGARYLRFSYDALQRIIAVSDPINRQVRFGYDVNGDLAVVTDTRNLTWTYSYSGTTHLLTQIIDPDGHIVERNQYDAQGRVVKQWNGNNQPVITLNYAGNTIITATDALTHTTIDRYASGAWSGVTDASTYSTTQVYDGNLQPIYVADTNGNATQMQWSDDGSNLQQLVNAAGFTTTLAYDTLNHPILITDTRGLTTSYTYSGSLLTRQSDALGNTTYYTYGQNNLLIAQQDALGHVTRYGYDPSFGQRIAITDALTNVTRYAYDGVGRLITTTDALGRMTVNGYDKTDHLITVTNNYTSTTAQPNYLNAYNLITRYGYDGAGRQILIADTLGQVSRNGYDAAGRLVSATLNFSPTVEQNYSNIYNLITRYGYDAAGNQIRVTDTLTHVMKTDYDKLNRPITVTMNYINGVSDPNEPDKDVLRITTYDPAGNVTDQTDALGRVTHTWYDNLNRVISTSANYLPGFGQNYLNTYNLITRYGYDETGNQMLVTDTVGHVTRNYYDPLNRVISTTVNYTTASSLPYYQNQYNLITRYSYDKVGNRIVVTDPMGNPTYYAYDVLNRVVTTTNALSGKSVTRYDAIGNQIKTIDALTHTQVYTYDLAGRLIAQADAVGNITRYQYDALGRTVAVTDALTHTTRTFYDVAGRVVSMTNALTGTTVITYNALGQRVGFINENGKSSYSLYDGVGRTIAVTDATGVPLYTVYDALGNRIKSIDALGHTSVYTYDTANRLSVQAVIGMGLPTTRYAYDALGNRVVMTDANGVATGYGYDALNRLKIVTESMTTTGGLNPNSYNLMTTYQYDPVGNRTVMTNARGYTTTYVYDALYRVTALSDPLSHTTRYQYDILGNQIVMTDANNNVTVSVYDALNRPVVITYTAEAKTVKYTYDKVGNRILMTDSLGVTRYIYDALNRPIQITDPYTGTITYTYDLVGNRTKLIYSDGKVVTNTYDAANRLTGLIDWTNQTTTYAYDRAGRLITTTLPNSSLSIAGYDNADRLVTLAQLGPYWTLATYTYTLDALGNRVAVIEQVLPPTPIEYLPIVMNNYSDTLDGGEGLQGGTTFESPLLLPDAFQSPLESSSSSNRSARQSDLTWLLAPLMLIVAVKYKKNKKTAMLLMLLAGTLAAVGLAQPSRAMPGPMPFLSPEGPPPSGCTYPTAITDTVSISYTYDPLGRLTAAAYSSGECYQYGYDPVGNRTAQTATIASTVVTTYTYDSANRLTKVGTTNYTWDNNGNLTNDGNSLYRYDQANRMISATLAATTTLFNYNGDGVRLKQVIAGVPTTYTQDLAAPLPVVLQARTGTVATQYLFSLGTRPVAQYTSSAWQYLLSDALGSVRQIADASGNVLLTESYEPYGKLLSSSGSASSIFAYAGEQIDQSGLIFLRARYMNPGLGIFLSHDPWSGDQLQPGSMNGFGYVEGNPVNQIDPSGRSPRGNLTGSSLPSIYTISADDIYQALSSFCQNLTKPDITFLSLKIYQLAGANVAGSFGYAEQLDFGYGDFGGKLFQVPGSIFIAKVLIPPSASGQIQFIQEINPNRSFTGIEGLEGESVMHELVPKDQWAYDGAPGKSFAFARLSSEGVDHNSEGLYSKVYQLFGFARIGVFTTWDSPGTYIPVLHSRMQVHDEFKMHLAWKPDGGQLAGLAMATWGWSATATKGANGWSISAASSHAEDGQPTSSLPQNSLFFSRDFSWSPPLRR
jgi:RHS repeat-associated protein